MIHHKNLSVLRNRLTKPAQDVKDLQVIYEILSKTPLKEKFFKLILAMGKNEQFLFEICRGFVYKFYNKGEVIFEEGDENTEYLYIIIKGQVGVYRKSALEIAVEKSSINLQKQDINFENENVPTIYSSLKKSIGPLKVPRKSNFLKSQNSLVQTQQNSVVYESPEPSQPANLLELKNEKTGQNKVKRPIEGLNGLSGVIQSNRLEYKLSHENNLLLLPEIKINRNSIFDIEAVSSRLDVSYRSKFDKKSSNILNSNMNSSYDFLKNVSPNQIFQPTTDDEISRLKIFESRFLNDDTMLNEETILSIMANFGEKIRDLHDWALFGELSQEISRPRTASIVCLKNTEIIKIKQTDYKNIIKGALKAKKVKMCEFLLKSLCLSHKMKEMNLVTSILPIVKKIRVKKGDFIGIQGCHLENFFMIKKGEFKMTKIVTDNFESCFYNKFDYLKIEQIESKLKGKRISIGMFGSNEIIGEEFLFDENAKFEYSVECVSSTGTLVYFKSRILKTFPSRFQEIWKEVHLNKQKFWIYQYQKNLMLLLENHHNNTHLIEGTGLQKALTNRTDSTLDNIDFQNKICNLKKQEGISRGIAQIYKRYKSLPKIGQGGSYKNSQQLNSGARMKEITDMSILLPKLTSRRGLQEESMISHSRRTEVLHTKHSLPFIKPKNHNTSGISTR
jgi:CRP-like cAMP-binding protein